MSSEPATTRLSEISIEPKTGAVSIGSALVLTPRGSIPPAIPSKVLKLRAIRDMHTGYVWHDFEGASFAGKPCILRVCILGNCITRVSLDFLQAEHSGPLWADRAEVMRQIAIARFALSGMLGRSFVNGAERFPWGSAHAGYDDKSGGVPSIGFRYDR
jgi:hypothetical protein